MSVKEGLKIQNIKSRAVAIPAAAIPGAPLVLIDLETDQGITGRAYLFSYALWTLKPIMGCVEGLASMIKGDQVAPVMLAEKLSRYLMLLDTPGLVGLALAGVDMAAWDALAQSKGVPLVELLGGQVRSIRAYQSGALWLWTPVEDLADEAEEQVASKKFSGIKIKLGRDAEKDLLAVRSVKKRLGEGIALMVDYNQQLSLNEALMRTRMLDDEGLAWIEEPVRHFDYEAYARIRASIKTPLQTGENFVSIFEMQKAISQQSLDYVMPDVQRLGVTGWLKASALACTHGIDISNHMFPEYSVHLLAVAPTCHWLEYMDLASPILKEPLEIKDGYALIPDRPGVGIEWDEAAIKQFEIA